MLIVLANKHKLNDILIPPNRTVASLSTNLITNMCLKNVDANRLWQKRTREKQNIISLARSCWRTGQVDTAGLDQRASQSRQLSAEIKPHLWDTNLFPSFCRVLTEGSERSLCRSENCWCPLRIFSLHFEVTLTGVNYANKERRDELPPAVFSEGTDNRKPKCSRLPKTRETCFQ